MVNKRLQYIGILYYCTILLYFPAADTKVDDQINTLLKMPLPELHRELVERCRQGFILCLQRFPTHYKSHYRLAYIYMHSPYHKVPIILGKFCWYSLSFLLFPCLFQRKSHIIVIPRSSLSLLSSLCKNFNVANYSKKY